MKVQWQPGGLLNAVHYLWTMAEDRQVDPAAVDCDGAAESAIRAFDALPVRKELWWQHLGGLAGGIPNPRELIEVALRKSGCRDAGNVARLADDLTKVQQAIERAHPELASELNIRSNPLQHLWGERGPGMMRQLEASLPEQVLADQAHVWLVYPFAGGQGNCFLNYNSVAIEAVLANPDPVLAETVRLGWLLSQLQLDLPEFSERIPPARHAAVASAGMVPVALEAAAKVDWTTCDERMVQHAFSTWHIPADAAIVWNWYQTYLDLKPPLAVALAALDHELSAA